MSVEITIPSPGESVTEVTVGVWLKQDGDWVDQDEPICEIESDKATLEVGAPAAGVLNARVEVGTELEVGAVLGTIDTDAKPPAAAEPPADQANAPEPEPKTAAPAADSETATARASTMAT